MQVQALTSRLEDQLLRAQQASQPTRTAAWREGGRAVERDRAREREGLALQFGDTSPSVLQLEAQVSHVSPELARASADVVRLRADVLALTQQLDDVQASAARACSRSCTIARARLTKPCL